MAKMGEHQLKQQEEANQRSIITERGLTKETEEKTTQQIDIDLIRETKQWFHAAYYLYPKTHDNINFILDYIKFLSKYSKNKKNVISILLHALEEDPYNDVILSAFSNNLTSTCDPRVEVLFCRALSYHNDVHVRLLYADYIQYVVKDNDKAHLTYKTALDSITTGDVVQENVKLSIALTCMGLLFESYFQDYSAASEAFMKAVQLDNESYLAHFSYANFLAKVHQDNNNARYHYFQALYLNPNATVLKPLVKFLREVDKNPVLAIAAENWLYPPHSMLEELQFLVLFLTYVSQSKK